MSMINLYKPVTFQASFWLLIMILGGCSSNKDVLYNNELNVVKQRAAQQLRADITTFNHYTDRPEPDGPYNAKNNQHFLEENIPLFLSSDSNFTRVYNYRWWMISKHLKQFEDPEDGKNYWVVTEFFGNRPWASRSGAITCPAGHQFYDVRFSRIAQLQHVFCLSLRPVSSCLIDRT